MKILITNHQLKERGGSELFALEIGLALQARAHEVCLFSTLEGGISKLAEKAGLAFVQDPAACPFRPDLIHGQHHLETMTALAHWADVPGIYFLHGATPWEEYPPRHPRLLRYLGTSPRFGAWIARECGVAAEQVHTVRNFFDPAKFSQTRASDHSTKRAAVFHNTMDPEGKPYAAIRQACETVGLKLDGVGARFGRLTSQPEIDLLNYDVVFAGGRSGIEAMACGCAVIPVTKEQAAQRIHPGNYVEMADRNFTAETSDPPVKTEQIVTELRALNQSETMAVTARIRSEATLDRTVEALLEHYQSVIAAHKEAGAATLATAAAESACVGNYLLSLAQRVKEVDEKRLSLLEQKDSATARAEKWQQTATRETKRLQQIQSTLEAGSWWQRRLWRRLRREFGEP